MKTVAFNELVPGMVLYPIGPEYSGERMMSEYIVLAKKTDAGEDTMWGEHRMLHYLSMHHPYEGICVAGWHTGDDDLWAVVDDPTILEMLRAAIKKDINRHRDHMDEVERLVDEHL
jgi:hypothetical protein